jgi:hypothetical protein
MSHSKRSLGNRVRIDVKDELVTAIRWKTNCANTNVDVGNYQWIRELDGILLFVDNFTVIEPGSDHTDHAPPSSVGQGGEDGEGLILGRKLVNNQTCENTDRRWIPRVQIHDHLFAQNQSHGDGGRGHGCSCLRQQYCVVRRNDPTLHN